MQACPPLHVSRAGEGPAPSIEAVMPRRLAAACKCSMNSCVIACVNALTSFLPASLGRRERETKEANSTFYGTLATCS